MRSTPTAPSPLCAGIWRVLGWIGVLLIAAVLAMVWTARQSQMTWAMVIFLVAGLAVQWLEDQLPSVFIFQVVLVALVNGAGGAFGWFDSFRWFDEIVHAYTGFAGLSAIGYLYARDHEPRRATLVGWCAGMGLALGIGWEMVEGLMGDLAFMDTLSDLVLDTMGAAMGGLFARHALRAVHPMPVPVG